MGTKLETMNDAVAGMHGASAADFLDNARRHLIEERRNEVMRRIVEALGEALNGGDE